MQTPKYTYKKEYDNFNDFLAELLDETKDYGKNLLCEMVDLVTGIYQVALDSQGRSSYEADKCVSGQIDLSENDTRFNKLARHICYLYVNRNNSDVSDDIKKLRVLRPVFSYKSDWSGYRNSPDFTPLEYGVLFSQYKKIVNEKISYDFLQRFCQRLNNKNIAEIEKIYKAVLQDKANHQSSTIDDMYDLARYLSNKISQNSYAKKDEMLEKELWEIVKRIENRADAEIKAEFEQTPDINKVQHVCQMVKYAAELTKDENYKTLIAEKFSVDKLTLGGIDHLEIKTKSIITDNTNLKTENEKLIAENKSLVAENNRLTQYNQQLVEEKNKNSEKYEADIAELNKQIRELQNKNTLLTTQVGQYKVTIKSMEEDVNGLSRHPDKRDRLQQKLAEANKILNQQQVTI